MITRVGMAPRRRGMSIREFQHHWRTDHADAARAIPNLRGYVQNHAVLDDGGRPLLPYPGFDACAETYFSSLESMDEGFASPRYQQDVRADEQLLIHRPAFSLLLCRRRVALERGPVDGAAKLMTFLRAHPLTPPERLVEVVLGPYAEIAAAAGPLRHEQLTVDLAAHAGRQSPACDVVDVLWFPSPRHVLGYLTSDAAVEADTLLAGVAFGRERLLARSVTVVPPAHP